MIKKILKNHLFLLTSVLVNLFFLIFILLVCGTYYELSDDWFFAKNIADGNYDYTFCSFFIQILTGLLQKIIYPFNAFMILQVILGFIALTSICYILLDTFKFKKGILFVLIIECIFAVNIYSIITFTKTAAFLATAGGLMMLWAYHCKKHIGYSLFGIVMVLFGSFYRMKIFYSVLAIFFFFICACMLYEVKKVSIKSLFDVLKKVLSVQTVSLVLAMLCSVFVVDVVSRAIIYSGEGMDYYKEYNSLRSSVVDFAMPDYSDESVAEKFQSIGISKNDFAMMRKWYLDDQGNADVETLTKICELQQTEKTGVHHIINSMLYEEFMYVVNLTPEGIIILSYLIMAAVILLLHKNKSFLLVGAITFGIGILYSYLWIGGRSNYRAVFSILISAIVCLLYSTRFMEYRQWVQNIRQHKSKLFSIVSASACIVFSLVYLYLTTTITPAELPATVPAGYPKLEEFINSSEDKIFALDRKSYLCFRNAKKLKHPLVLDEEDEFDKCVYFGSTYYAHPRYNELLEDAGIENLYTDIIDSDNIYFVDHGDIKMFVKYLNEQYGDKNNTYGYKLVANASPFKIYKIITVKK